MFVNNVLALDIGGTHPATTKEVFLDALGLLDGRTYSVDAFYADRHPREATLLLNTNVCLVCQTKYDACGTCVTDPADAIYKCDVDHDDGDALVVANRLTKNIQCTLEYKGNKNYEFTFEVDLEYPYTQPSGIVVSLGPYNNDVRRRGTCDNRATDTSSAWSNVDRLWDPTLVDSTARR